MLEAGRAVAQHDATQLERASADDVARRFWLLCVSGVACERCGLELRHRGAAYVVDDHERRAGLRRRPPHADVVLGLLQRDLAAPAMGDCLSRCPRWLQQYTACTRQHGLQWRSDAWYGGDPHAWIAETRQMLGSTRAAIRAERQRMMRERRAPVEASPQSDKDSVQAEWFDSLMADMSQEEI